MFFRIQNNKKNAFSMVELMMLLLIASLIVAASVPIITKKHLRIPTSVNHGSYMCYYKDGHLWEARKSGRINQKMLAGYPRETTKCIFEPPTKASLFQIIAIGGGGGGGDAGYTGNTSTVYRDTERDLTPFNLTNNSFLSMGVEDNGDALNEVKSYLGHLWAFGEGADSGRPGKLYYTNVSIGKGTEVHTCPANHTEMVYQKQYIGSGTQSVTLCEGRGYDQEKTVNATIYEYFNKANGKKVATRITFNGAYAECSEEVEVHDCVYPNPRTYACDVPKFSHYIDHDAEYGDCITGYETITVECANQCTYKNQQNCNKGPCTKQKPIVERCLVKAAWQEAVYDGTVPGECEYECVDTVIRTEPKTWIETAPDDVYYMVYDNIDEEDLEDTSKYSSKEAYYYNNDPIEYEVGVPSGCAVNNKTDSISYFKDRDDSSYEPGHGPFCTTPSISGTTGLNYSEFNNVPPNSAPDGEDINGKSSLKAASPHSFCDDLGKCGTSVGQDYGGTYAQATLGSYTIKANSAPQGATGNTLNRTSVILDMYDYTTFDTIVTIAKTFYYDEIILNSGSNGTDGTCEPVSANKPDCRRIKLNDGTSRPLNQNDNNRNRVGYCLQHDGDSEDNAKEGDTYKYYSTYEINTLTKGYNGTPGEFKTIVVRSLNGVDRTINIGRGGSAATLNFGGNGSNGSATTFGTMLQANGGIGGIGRQAAPEASGILPKFNKNNMNFTKLKTCLTTSTLDSDAQCANWKANTDNINFYRNTSGGIGDSPHKSFLGGMFSFLFTHISSSNNDIASNLLEYAGKGGSGGGVQHFCWAGQYILNFEGHELYKSSVYHDGNVPAGKGVPENNIIPATCRSAYENIPATPGFDGALIITW